jgi:hypothetical protein
MTIRVTIHGASQQTTVSLYSCSWLPAVSGCCALRGVTRGVISASVPRQRLDASRR